MPRRKRSPLLLRVLARIGEARIEERYLAKEQDKHVYGLNPAPGKGVVIVNPIPNLVDTLLHEILHDLYPDHKEQAILSLTGKLMKQLTDDELQTIYRVYRERVNADI